MLLSVSRRIGLVALTANGPAEHCLNTNKKVIFSRLYAGWGSTNRSHGTSWTSDLQPIDELELYSSQQIEDEQQCLKNGERSPLKHKHRVHRMVVTTQDCSFDRLMYQLPYMIRYGIEGLQLRLMGAEFDELDLRIRTILELLREHPESPLRLWVNDNPYALGTEYAREHPEGWRIGLTLGGDDFKPERARRRGFTGPIIETFYHLPAVGIDRPSNCEEGNACDIDRTRMALLATRHTPIDGIGVQYRLAETTKVYRQTPFGKNIEAVCRWAPHPVSVIGQVGPNNVRKIISLGGGRIQWLAGCTAWNLNGDEAHDRRVLKLWGEVSRYRYVPADTNDSSKVG